MHNHTLESLTIVQLRKRIRKKNTQSKTETWMYQGLSYLTSPICYFRSKYMLEDAGNTPYRRMLL